MTEYGKLYGTLVMAGKRALSDADNVNNLPIVPEKYKDEASKYISWVLDHGTESAEKTIAQRVEEQENEISDLQIALIDVYEKVLGV